MTEHIPPLAFRAALQWVRHRPIWFLIAGVLLMTLLQWIYLNQIGAINGQEISPVQAALIATSNWMPYLLIYGLFSKSLSRAAGTPVLRVMGAVVLVLVVLVALAVWETASILGVVPSGHAFTALLTAHLRSGLLENVLSIAALCGLIYAVRTTPADHPAPLVEVRDGARTLQIASQDILFVEAEDYYVRVHAEAKSWLVRRPLYEMLEALAPVGFMRVSRSAILAIAQVRALSQLDGGKLRAEFENGQALMISKTYRKAFKEAWRQRS